MAKIITLNQLRIGQRYVEIPTPWFGESKLISKRRRTEYEEVSYMPLKLKKYFVYDIKFAGNVINPPGLIYGLRGTTKVRLLSKGEKINKKWKVCP